jgi:hypothetical protein
MARQNPGAPRLAAIVMLASLVLPLSCSTRGTQIVYLQFRPTADPAFSVPLTVGLSPFQDARPTPQTIGKRTRVDGTSEPIMIGSPTVAQDLTQILTRQLESRGARVTDLPGWKPEPDSLRDLPRDIRVAMTGRIDALEVNADSTLFKTTIRYRIRLTGFIGSVDRGEILTRSVEISPQRTFLQFDIRDVEEELNVSLAEALARLVQGALPPSP